MTRRDSATYDIIIAGGGVMGCAIGYYLLKADPGLRVAIVERDSTYARSSTVLSDGNHRVQFNLAENIRMSLYGLEVLARFGDEMAVGGERPAVGFRRQGNLFLVDEAGRNEAAQGLALQQQLGGRVGWLSPEELARRYPMINAGICVGATFGADDGTMDPQAVLMAYRRKAISLGAVVLEATVATLRARGGAMVGVTLASGEALDAGVVVNAAGAWAGALARTVDIPLPVQPVRRQVFVVEADLHSQGWLPLILLPSGLYIIHEHGNRFMCGKSLPDDPVAFDFSWDQAVFTENLWPELAAAISAFDRLRVVSGWAGLYAVNTLDGNAILGEWPALRGAFLANGFSGHGFQHCHAVGRHLAELILGQPTSLDLSRFSPRRILENEPVFENARRLI